MPFSYGNFATTRSNPLREKKSDDVCAGVIIELARSFFYFGRCFCNSLRQCNSADICAKVSMRFLACGIKLPTESTTSRVFSNLLFFLVVKKKKISHYRRQHYREVTQQQIPIRPEADVEAETRNRRVRRACVRVISCVTNVMSIFRAVLDIALSFWLWFRNKALGSAVYTYATHTVLTSRLYRTR